MTNEQKATIGLVLLLLGLLFLGIMGFYYITSNEKSYGSNKFSYALIAIGALVILFSGIYLYVSNSSDTDSSPSTDTGFLNFGKTSKKTQDMQKESVVPFSYYLAENNPYTPQQVASAYLGNLPYNGLGQKIAIITCYNYNYLQRDFDVFCKKYDLPSKTLNIYNYSRFYSKGWAVETCLDVQWSHVFAPKAEIYVIQAATARYSDLAIAIQKAVSLGVDIVSMSFGSYESPGAHRYLEPIFTNTANKDIIFMAASGDYSEVSYPSSSGNVVSVGGTNLFIQYDGLYNTKTPQEANYTLDPVKFKSIGETDWASRDGTGTGHGISLYFQRPSYQNGHNASAFRSTPDLSLIAATPSGNGISIYCGGWYGVQGTSASAPILAGMLATINSTRTHKLNREEFLTKLYNTIPTNLPVRTSADGVGFVSRLFIEKMVTMV